MSILAAVYPAQVAVPAAQAFVRVAATVARPLVGVGALMTLTMMFKPLVKGMLQATALVFHPRLSLEERNSRRTLRDVLMLNRMAKELELSQPNQAAELRWLASRG